MSSPYRVVWSEGLLMMPQHLQQQDGYHEQLAAQMLRAANPYGWGVSKLELDPAALQSGQIRVSSFAGILADGMPLSFEPRDPEAPPARPIEPNLAPGKSALDVFLAVPREREGNANYAGLASAAAGSAPARYKVRSRSVLDLASQQGAATIAFAHPNLLLLFGGEPLDDFETLKIAEVKRLPSGGFAFEDSYIPPCLRIGASAGLCARLKRASASLVAKQRDLVASQRQPEAGNVEFGPSDVARGLQLLGLNQVIPLVQHLVSSPETPPLQAYLTLAQTAGLLCTFTADGDSSALPQFQFTDLRRTFDSLIDRITEMLGGVARARYVSVPLEVRKDGLYLGSLQDERLASCREFILAVRSSMPEEQVADVLPRLCRVASRSEIQHLFQAASPGLALSVTHRPPSEIPLRPGVVYFQLPMGDPHWRSIAAERAIAIFLPPPFDPAHTRLELLAIPGPASGGGSREASQRFSRNRPASFK